MTDNYMYPNINLERATAVKSFIFDPNATSDEDGTVFSDWQSMLGNISSIPGIKEIIIPGTVGSSIPTVIPPGNYDMTDIVLTGDNAFSAIEINDAVFENLQSISQLSVFVGQTAANSVPSFQISGGSAYVLTLDRVILAASPLATAPMFRVSGVSGALISPVNSTFASAGVPVFDVLDTSAVTLNQPAGAGAGNNYGGGPGSAAFFSVAVGASFTITGFSAGDVYFASNQLPGVATVTFASDYEPAVLADWSGIQPLSIKNALDRIAAAIGPIPP